MPDDGKKVPAEVGGTEVAGKPDEKKQTNPAIAAIAGVCGYSASRMLPPGVRNGFLFGGLFGAIVGLLPFAVARYRNLPDDGNRAVGYCALWGMFGGLVLAVPASLYFTYRVATATTEGQD